MRSRKKSAPVVVTADRAAQIVQLLADLDWLQANAPKRYAAAMADIKRIVGGTEVTP